MAIRATRSNAESLGLMCSKGFEPLRLAAPPPQDGMSAIPSRALAGHLGFEPKQSGFGDRSTQPTLYPSLLRVL